MRNLLSRTRDPSRKRRPRPTLFARRCCAAGRRRATPDRDRQGGRHRPHRSDEGGPRSRRRSDKPQRRCRPRRRSSREADGGLRIGAMVTLARLAADDDGARKLYPALADAAGDSASPEIRNVATLGGNLLQRPRCWYFRSPPIPLPAQGRRALLRDHRREPASRDFRQPLLRHRASLDFGDRAGRARRRVELVDDGGATRTPRAGGFLRRPRQGRAARERSAGRTRF